MKNGTKTLFILFKECIGYLMQIYAETYKIINGAPPNTKLVVSILLIITLYPIILALFNLSPLDSLEKFLTDLIFTSFIFYISSKIPSLYNTFTNSVSDMMEDDLEQSTLKSSANDLCGTYFSSFFPSIASFLLFTLLIMFWKTHNLFYPNYDLYSILGSVFHLFMFIFSIFLIHTWLIRAIYYISREWKDPLSSISRVEKEQLGGLEHLNEQPLFFDGGPRV